MIIETTSIILAGAVAQNGSFSMPYPEGTTPSMYTGIDPVEGHYIVVDDNDRFDGDVELSFGLYNITVINRTGTTLKKYAKVYLGIEAPDINAAEIIAAMREVNAKAVEVAENAATVADQAGQVASDKVVVSADKEAAALSAAAAAASELAAQQAVANPSVAYDLLTTLNADLAHAAGTVGQVLADGTNNGFYVKVGASGTGSWSKKSNATVPGLDARTGFISFVGRLEKIAALRDKVSRKLIWWADAAGYFRAKLPISVADGLRLVRDANFSYNLLLGREDGSLPLGGGASSSGNFGTTERDIAAFRDPATRKRILLLRRSGEVWGKFRDETGRPFITDGYAPLDIAKQAGAVWGREYLCEIHQRLQCIRNGAPRQAVIAVIGDSWTTYTLSAGYMRALIARLSASYGDAGPGWIGFSFSSGGTIKANARTDVSVSKTGSWTSAYTNGSGPDIGHVVSGASGDKYTIGLPAGLSAVTLFHRGGGSVRYRWGGGSWVDLTLSGGILATAALASIPPGASTLEIEATSIGAVLVGLDAQMSGDGVRVHKLGASGSNLLDWTSVDAANFEAGLSGLAPNTVIILHGTNDQSAYSPEAAKVYLQTLVNRIRTATPLADILLVTPPENARVGNIYPMSGYANAHREVAFENNIAHLNLQYSFGIDPDDYALTGRNWFSDEIHAATANGQAAITGALLPVLERGA